MSQSSSAPRATDEEVSPWPDGTGFVYLGISPWAGMWKNRHQLMSRFAQEIPVLYVEPWRRIPLRDLLRCRPSPRRLWRDFRRPLLTTGEGGVKVLWSPSYLPVSGASHVRRATVNAWLRRVRRAARMIGITRPVLWVSHPEMYEAVGGLGEVLTIYHIVDDYAGYTGAERLTWLSDKEQQLLDRVDVTFAVTPELIAAREKAGRHLVLIENAVDFNSYAAAARDGALLEAMVGVPRPRYGYSGLIGVRLDLQLLIEFARSTPDSSLVLAGKVDPRGCEALLDELFALPNVHFLGELPPASVPKLVAGFDVGLLPYQLNRETTHISPLKLYEYLAAAKPVISTPIPAARRHSGLVRLGQTAGEFRAAGRELLADDNEILCARRRQFAAENTWEHRVSQIKAELLPLLRDRRTGAGALPAE